MSPPSLRGRLTVVRAGVEIDIEAACGLYAEAFGELAGRDPASAAEAGSEMCQHAYRPARVGR